VIENIFVAVISSVTSIVVALISAGFFKRYMEKKGDASSKKKLIKQIEKDELVHFTLKEIRRKYNADRIYIIQFHNGGIFYTNSPMQKASVTFERCSDGLERVSDHLQHIFVSHYTWFIKHSLGNTMYYTDCENIEDVATKALLRKFGTQGTAATPIFDVQDQLVSILALDWVFSEIPTDFVKDGEFTQEFKDELLADSESVGNLII
jgi:hypothetical protein